MLLALTCALCTVQPLAAPVAWNLRETPLSLQQAGPEAPPSQLRLAPQEALVVPLRSVAPPPLASLPPLDTGSGDGAPSDHSDHSGHMGPMWIVMGVVMVGMMVGVGAYAMSHRSAPAGPSSATALPSPALLALPVVARGGG
jgi:hypothetical protein